MDLSDLPYIMKNVKDQFTPWSNVSNDKKYYFMHIPKTAGTSFRYSLYDGLDNKKIYPNPVEYFFKQKAKYLDWKTYLTRYPNTSQPKPILIGHFGLAPSLQYREQPPMLLTFMRKPLDRVKSAIAYQMRRNRRYADLSMEEILNQFLEYESIVQCLAFGYVPGVTEMEELFNRLDNFDFVGITEEYEMSIDRCNKILGWKLKSLGARNQSDYRDVTFSEGDLNRIEEAVQFENLLYDYAVSKISIKS